MSQVLLPKNLDQLWDMRDEHPNALVYAGGTDLLVKLRQSLISAPVLICLERIEELKQIDSSEDRLELGALCSHAELLAHPMVQKRAPVLTRALSQLGSPPIRRMGTLGGNLATASPAGDSLPPFYVLDAQVELLSRGASRSLPLSQFIIGPGQTGLQPGEIIASVSLERPERYNLQHFEKVGQRKALAISVASLAAAMEVSEDGMVQQARLAWGSLGPTVITCPEAEQALQGAPLDEQSLNRAAGLAAQAVHPISDVRASAEYRQRLAANLLFRLSLPQ